jgi:hypothetical protein
MVKNERGKRKSVAPTLKAVPEADYGLKYLTFSSDSPNTLVMPMIVVEEETTFEIRDCYLRSIRKDTVIV